MAQTQALPGLVQAPNRKSKTFTFQFHGLLCLLIVLALVHLVLGPEGRP